MLRACGGALFTMIFLPGTIILPLLPLLARVTIRLATFYRVILLILPYPDTLVVVLLKGCTITRSGR